jgi:hypothetical protein
MDSVLKLFSIPMRWISHYDQRFFCTNDKIEEEMMSHKLHNILVLCLLLASFSVQAQSGSIDVKSFGAAADGKKDNTAAFQRALDKAGKTGTIVNVPAGQYAFNGSLNIPEGVTLAGVWPGPHTAQTLKGTTFLVLGGRDNESGTPFLNLKTGSTVKGVTIFYPEQKVEDIRPYPWTIQGQGQHFNVIDVTIANAYNGIDCGTFHNEGHHLRNILMCAVNKGVFIDYCTDIGRLENVHIHNVYWWRVGEPYRLNDEQVKALEVYTRANLIGFIIGRTDWEYISNSFVIWAKIGFHFIKSEQGKANALITQSGSDLGPLAVKIEEVQDHAGVIFENCQFMSGFEISEANLGPVKLSNCGFWGRPGSNAQMDLYGQGTVTLTATHFHKWDYDKTGVPCVRAMNGSLLMSGCDFMGKNHTAPHIYLGPNLKSAAISGNRFQYREKQIINESTGDVQIFGNVSQ